MKKVRVGFVGLGSVCLSRHVPGLRRIPDVEIVAVANRGQRSTERAAAQNGIPVACPTWGELVWRDDVDVVFIGAWPYIHKPVTLAALEAGKHVFCQARMAMDYAEALEMRDAARGSGLVAGLCPVPIGLSVDAVMRRLLGTGILGEIRLVRVQSFTDAYAAPETPMDWRKDHRLSGINMHTLGMYFEVIHRWFGPTWTVSAQNQTFAGQRVDMDGETVRVRIPDQVICTAGMRSGFPVQYTISTAVHHGDDEIQVFGSKGSLVYDVGEDMLYGALAGESLAPVAIMAEEKYDVGQWRVEREFIDAIRSGTPFHPDFDDGLRYMRAVQAVYDSAREGRTVMLDQNA